MLCSQALCEKHCTFYHPCFLRLNDIVIRRLASWYVLLVRQLSPKSRIRLFYAVPAACPFFAVIVGAVVDLYMADMVNEKVGVSSMSLGDCSIRLIRKMPSCGAHGFAWRDARRLWSGPASTHSRTSRSVPKETISCFSS